MHLNFQEDFDSVLHQRIIKKLTSSGDKKENYFVYCKLVKKIGKLLALNYHSSWGSILKSAFFVQRKIALFKQVSGLSAKCFDLCHGVVLECIQLFILDETRVENIFQKRI